MNTIASFLADYESGLFTEGETISRIIDLASTQDPIEFMPDVPKNYADVIRSLPHIADPPKSPEQVLIASGMMHGLDDTVSEAFAEARLKAFLAFQAMHIYFYASHDAA
jgi:hypothetical protein